MPDLRRPALALLAGLALGLLASPARADATADGGAADASRPFLVKIHADWCGTCQKLNPTWLELEREVGDGARMVILDVTDRERLEASQALAEQLGLAAFFAEYKARTGTIAVLRGDDRAKVEVFKGVTEVAPYEGALARARSADRS